MRRALPAIAVDVVLLVLFAALGRRTHDEGSPIGGTLVVAAPFVIGYLAAAAAVRLDRRPVEIARGAAVWALGIPVGLLLRGTAFDRGLAPAFVAVAILTTGVFLVGWRAAYHLASVRRRRGSAGADTPT